MINCALVLLTGAGAVAATAATHANATGVVRQQAAAIT
jgi:hypothetical protein